MDPAATQDKEAVALKPRSWSCFSMYSLAFVLAWLICTLAAMALLWLFSSNPLDWFAPLPVWLPAVILLYQLWMRNNMHVMPPRSVYKDIWLGIIIAAPVIGISFGLQFGLEQALRSLPPGLGSILLRSAISAFLLAATIEETFKWLVPRATSRNKFTTIPYAVVVSAGVAGISFGCMETGVYLLLGLGIDGAAWDIMLLRLFVTAPAHAAWTMISATRLCHQRWGPEPGKHSVPKQLLPSVLLHGAYNMSLLTYNALLAVTEMQFPGVTVIRVFFLFLAFAVALLTFWYADNRVRHLSRQPWIHIESSNAEQPVAS